MAIPISDLYNKKVISQDGKVLGDVKGVILNMDEGGVSHLLLDNVESLIRSGNLRTDFLKNSIMFKRVKKISETIIVGEK